MTHTMSFQSLHITWPFPLSSVGCWVECVPVYDGRHMVVQLWRLGEFPLLRGVLSTTGSAKL